MILVDTSIWIHHLHRPEPALVELLARTQVCTHPMVIGELALGSLRDRAWVLELVADLPGTPRRLLPRCFCSRSCTACPDSD